MLQRYHGYRLRICWLLLALIACTERKPERKPSEITRVSFATGGCNGRCPLMALEVDSSLAYQFYGGLYSEKPGFWTGKISTDLWDSITNGLEKIKFRDLDSSYQASVDDLATETIVFFGKRQKRVRAQSASLPRPVDSLLKWLMYSFRKVQLVPSHHSLTFHANPEHLVELPPPVFPGKPRE